MRAVAEVKSGQLRQWCFEHYLGDCNHFVVLHSHTISRVEPVVWTDPGWYILIGGRQQWVAEVDIEGDSILLEDI